MDGKELNLKWFTLGVMGIVALAAGAEESWIRTNVLWDIVGAFWVAGLKVRSKGLRGERWVWTARAAVGRVAEEVRKMI